MTGHHVGIRVPDFEASVRWFVDKLDFRVVHAWPYGDLKLAYVAPPGDDHFFIEILGDGDAHPVPKPDWTDLGDSLRLAGHHHVCFDVGDVACASWPNPSCYLSWGASWHFSPTHSATCSNSPKCWRKPARLLVPWMNVARQLRQ